MTVFIIAAIVLMIFVFLILPGHPSEAQRAMFSNRWFAHRGLHTQDRTVPENSLPAFEAAARIGCGVELDVQLSKDGQVVVFHDDTLERVTGAQGRVDSRTLEELQQLRLCGTDATIPLFTQVLEVLNGSGPLIVELKTGPRNPELCRKTLEILRSYPGEYCIESFDPTIVGWFRRNAPDVLRGQLSDAQRNFTMLSTFKGFLLSRCLGNFVARPQFIAWGPGPQNLAERLVRDLGPLRVRWTVRPEEDCKALLEEYDALIFEFFDPPLRH